MSIKRAGAAPLTDSFIRQHERPGHGYRIIYDQAEPGFGIRITSGGARSFVLSYRTSGNRDRRFTIGSFPTWKTTAARTEARRLKREIDGGHDPMGALEADRNAKTIIDLCDRYERDELPRKRASTQREYKSLLDRRIRTAKQLKHLKVADVTYEHVDELHRRITAEGKPYAANRTVALLSKMMSLAIKWRWRSDNPTIGLERNDEEKRERYLKDKEFEALRSALDCHADRQAANIIRVLMMTGARRGEVLAMRWDQLDLQDGSWTKPAATTKQNKLHHVPLSPPVVKLLSTLRDEAEAAAKKARKSMSDYVFPGKGGVGHRIEIKGAWRKLCLAAKIVTIQTVKDEKGNDRTIVRPSARIHDLRHSYASTLAGEGLSLPVIGALLGHTQASTTHRYVHLVDEVLRKATNQAGAIISGQPPAPVHDITGARR